MLFSSTFRRSAFAPRTFASRPQLIPARQFQTYSHRRAADRLPSKDEISTESREYSKTGGDGAASGAVDDAAFNPDKTRPEEELESSKQQSADGKNPLDGSPANPELSKARGAQEGGATGSKAETGSGREERERTSGAGSPRKSGGGKRG